MKRVAEIQKLKTILRIEVLHFCFEGVVASGASGSERLRAKIPTLLLVFSERLTNHLCERNYSSTSCTRVMSSQWETLPS